MWNRRPYRILLALAAVAGIAAAAVRFAPSAPQSRNGTLVRLGSHVLGRETAPVTIIEFTDLQCPFCVRFTTLTFPELRTRFIDTGIVRFTTRDFPLDFHGYAVSASRAARCAGEQGKFWQLRWWLSRNAARLNDAVVLEGAGTLGIALAPFRTCFDGGRFEPEIRQDQAEAAAAGVSGTPTFLIGRSEEEGITSGYRLVGAQPIEEFEAVIQRLSGQAPRGDRRRD